MTIQYPETSDDDFYKKINKIYKRFTIPVPDKTFDEICFPKTFQLQLPQEFLSEYLNPETPYKSILIYHRIGAGKTCTAVRIGETWIGHRKIIVVLPASLKGNFRGELRSMCAGDNYLKPKERIRLSELHPSDPEYKEIIKKSDDRIDEYYSIYSYNKFIQLIKNESLTLDNSILIIDEIQNMVSEEGTYYNTLYDSIHRAGDKLRVVLLSATPMFDKPNEFALTMNLLRIPQELPTGREFYNTFVRIIERKDGKYQYKVKNMKYFKDCIRGYVSFFRGAPPYVFPKLIIRYVKCPMSEFQYRAYKDVLDTKGSQYNMKRDMLGILTVKDLPNNFHIGTRIVSNIVFPNRKINEQGFISFKGYHITKDLHIYSPKFDKIMKRIESSSGKVFIYSGFKEYGGIKSFSRVLDEYGYMNYVNMGEGKKRYAIWSGDENIAIKDEIRAVYNNKNNLSGNKIKILLGSPSINQGVSLTSVRQVHIIEPYWNQARLDQVIGRASRFCSHKDVSEEKRIVKVYIYIATFPEDISDEELKFYKETVDEHIHYLAEQKNKLVREFEKSIKEAAIDCKLNKNANVYEGEEDIVCSV